MPQHGKQTWHCCKNNNDTNFVNHHGTFLFQKIPFPSLPPQTLHLTDNSAGFLVLFFLVGNIIDDRYLVRQNVSLALFNLTITKMSLLKTFWIVPFLVLVLNSWTTYMIRMDGWPKTVQDNYKIIKKRDLFVSKCSQNEN